MTTITKERIELFIKNPLENGLTRGEQMELARIALASLGAEPVSQTYNLPQTHFEQVADLYEMQFDDGRTCAFHTDAQKAAQWLRACDGNRVQEYVKLERLQNAISGNSPVIPDGWISCSERMPAQDDWILIYSKHGEYMAGQVQGEYVELSDGTLSWLGNALYWMPLPEPPQEVNRG
ncbi:DUF551 domain-containing protein [Escherichia coli]|nr:DUF551 domain-containing protein [Escherichia coli]EJK7723825.1 DUF551 domain-containing protein [Escherichia coli]EKT9286680.1 DUF551 domain-containing protein [Escherichia coli]EKU4660974.1 DUF551 domain-containing protein [Escherichia coli]EKW3620515.1 DUF551 domain-containing protein [Escherichia coli]